ncbi:hypothetical protein ACWA1F_10150 [Flavobacterium sp. 3-218]
MFTINVTKGNYKIKVWVQKSDILKGLVYQNISPRWGFEKEG